MFRVSWPMAVTSLSSWRNFKASRDQPGVCSIPVSSLFMKASLSPNFLDQSVLRATKDLDLIFPFSFSNSRMSSFVIS